MYIRGDKCTLYVLPLAEKEEAERESKRYSQRQANGLAYQNWEELCPQDRSLSSRIKNLTHT